MTEKEKLINEFILPDHYRLWSTMEPFELHKKILTKDEYVGFLKGNIIKYQMRAGRKKGEPFEKDLAKLKTYQEALEKMLKPDLPF